MTTSCPGPPGNTVVWTGYTCPPETYGFRILYCITSELQGAERRESIKLIKFCFIILEVIYWDLISRTMKLESVLLAWGTLDRGSAVLILMVSTLTSGTT